MARVGSLVKSECIRSLLLAFGLSVLATATASAQAPIQEQHKFESVTLMDTELGTFFDHKSDSFSGVAADAIV